MENGFKNGILEANTPEEVRDISEKMCGKNY